MFKRLIKVIRIIVASFITCIVMVFMMLIGGPILYILYDRSYMDSIDASLDILTREIDR